VTFLAPDAFSNWYRLGNGETWGMAFLAAALFAAAKAWRRPTFLADAALMLFAVLAGLCKESFVAVIPALALLRAGVLHPDEDPTPAMRADSRSRARISAAILLALFAVLSICLLAVSLASGEHTECGAAIAGASTVTAKALSMSAVGVAILGGGWVPLLLLLAPTEARLGDHLRTGRLIAIAVLWVIPQVVIYHHRGGPLQRFALPASAGIGLVLALAVSELRRRRAWTLPLVLWLGAWVGIAGRRLNVVSCGARPVVAVGAEPTAGLRQTASKERWAALRG
jgi:hypothetical protein